MRTFYGNVTLHLGRQARHHIYKIYKTTQRKKKRGHQFLLIPTSLKHYLSGYLNSFIAPRHKSTKHFYPTVEVVTTRCDLFVPRYEHAATKNRDTTNISHTRQEGTLDSPRFDMIRRKELAVPEAAAGCERQEEPTRTKRASLS